MTSSPCATRSATISSRRGTQRSGLSISSPNSWPGPLDGSRAAGQERCLDSQAHQDRRRAGRALDRQRRLRPGTADAARTRRPAGRRQAAGRTMISSWEDIEFVQAVHATGRRKLIICALWTETCMAFAAPDAMREGYEVYPSPTRSRHLTGGPRGGPGPRGPGRRAADQLGLARRGASARLGSPGGPGDRRDRRHRPPAE